MDGRTVVRIFIEPDGKVTAEYRFNGMTFKDAAMVNLRLDQVKRSLLEAAGINGNLSEEDVKDIDKLLDGETR